MWLLLLHDFQQKCFNFLNFTEQNLILSKYITDSHVMFFIICLSLCAVQVLPNLVSVEKC